MADVVIVTGAGVTTSSSGTVGSYVLGASVLGNDVGTDVGGDIGAEVVAMGEFVGDGVSNTELADDKTAPSHIRPLSLVATATKAKSIPDSAPILMEQTCIAIDDKRNTLLVASSPAMSIVFSTASLITTT